MTPFAPTPATMEHRAVSSMILDAGGHVGSLRIDKSAAHGLGVFASAPIGEGELLLSVPRSLILYPPMAEVEWSSGITSAPEELRLMLLRERRAKASRWTEWLALLPAHFDLPAEWRDEEVSWLATAAVEADIRRERDDILRAFGVAQGHLPGLTLAEYMWAASAVASRAAHLSEGGSGRESADAECLEEDQSGSSPSCEEGECAGVPAIVPFGDMFNHSASLAPARARFDLSTGAYRYVSLQQVAEGEEVCLGYGCHDDDVLLRCYGFVPELNPHRRCALPFPLDSLPPEQREWASINGLGQGHHLTAEGPSWELMGAARLGAATAVELERGAALAILEGGTVSAECERRALRRIRKAAVARLAELDEAGASFVLKVGSELRVGSEFEEGSALAGGAGEAGRAGEVGGRAMGNQDELALEASAEQVEQSRDHRGGGQEGGCAPRQVGEVVAAVGVVPLPPSRMASDVAGRPERKRRRHASADNAAGRVHGEAEEGGEDGSGGKLGVTGDSGDTGWQLKIDVAQRPSIQAAPCPPTCHAASHRARTALAFRSAQEQVLRAAIAALDEALRDGGEQMTPALTT